MLGIVQNALTYTLPFLAVLTFVISFHELGHFIIARLCGVAVDRFSLGFGPPIVSWRSKSGMEWRISWIPLGGYVRFSGDENAASVPDAEDLAELRKQILAREGPAGLRRYFHFKPLWQRALVVAAGPLANFVLSIAIFATLLGAFGKPITMPRIGAVMANSPAAHAGFQPNDLIVQVDGRPLGDFADLGRYVALRTGVPIRFVINRQGRLTNLTATPERLVKKPGAKGLEGLNPGLGYLGLEASRAASNLRYQRFGPIGAVGEGVRMTAGIVGSSVQYIERMVQGQESGAQLSGVLGMAGRTGQEAAVATHGAPTFGIAAASLGLLMIQMVAFISASIGFANLLPIPVLDGGHLLFYAYEAVARRPLAARIQDAGYRVGFALLIALMLFATWNDLQRFGVFQLIGGPSS